MVLIRRIPITDDLNKYTVLDDLSWILNFCTVCNELMFEFYRCNVVVEKYCSDCSYFVEILEAELPLIDSQTEKDVDIPQKKVKFQSECDVCTYKHSIKEILAAILDLHADNQACSHCLALLNRNECSMSMSGDDNEPSHCSQVSSDLCNLAVASHDEAASDSNMSISDDDEEKTEEWGVEFSSEASRTASDIEFSASFTYLDYGDDENVD